tara:strand:- start:4245 stop:6596 length:2352 start_codon:yes stop_codon:yes gene_type:complete
MAKTGDKKIKYTISVELAQSQAKVNKLKNSVKELNDAIHIGDGRTKKNKKLKDQLIKTEERLTKATQRHTQAVTKNAGASQNSLFAINKQIQALQAENRLLDMNSQKFKDNSASIAQHANKMNKATGATGAASSATMELSRVVSDAPYGIRGVANNLSQFTSQMFYASQAAGGLGNALKDMGKLMLGPLGIVFAITTVISIMDYMSQQTDKTKKAINALAEATASGGTNLRILKQAIEDGTMTVEEQNKALAAANEEYEDLNLKVDENRQLTDDSVAALDAKVIVLQKIAKAMALQSLIEEQYAKQLPLQAKQAELNASADRKEIAAVKALSTATKESAGSSALASAQRARSAATDNENLSKEIDKEIDRLVSLGTAEDLIDEMLGGTKKSTKKPTDPDNNLGKSMAGGSLDMNKTNDKNRQKELLSVIRNEEEKQLIRDQFAQKALKSTKDNFDRAQLLRRDNFIKAQELRKVNNADDEFIQKDADRLIEESNETHNQTMLQSDETYNEAKKILEETQDTATFNRQQKRESEAVDRNLRMQAMQAEADAYVKEGRFTVKKDLYEIERAQALQEQDILRARYEALEVDSDERLRLEEQHSKRALEIKTDAAKREQEIEQAKANFRDQMLGHIGAGLGAASKLFKKNSTEAKIFALAEIAVGTAKGMIKGLEIAQNTSTKDGPFAAYTFPVYYASQVAAVLGAAASAKSVLQGGGSSGASGSGSSAPPEPSFSPEFNVVGNSGSNQLAEGIGSQFSEPTRAYVVYDDIQQAGSVVEESIESSGI